MASRFIAPAPPRSVPLPYRSGGIGEGIADAVTIAARAATGIAASNREADQRVAEIEHRAAQIEDQQWLDARNADLAVRYAETSGRIVKRVQEARAAAQPGAEGHEEMVGKIIDEETASFQESLDDPRLVAAWLPDIARLRAETSAREQGFAIEARATKRANDHVATREGLAATIVNQPDPASYENASAVLARLRAQSGLPGNAAEALTRDDEHALQGALVKGRIVGGDPRGALALLQSGALNALDGNEVAALTASAQAAIDRGEAEARAAQAAAITEFKDNARLMVEQVNDGVQHDPGALAGAAAKAREYGDEGLAYDLGKAAVRAGVMARYAGFSRDQLSAEIIGIENNPDWRKRPDLVEAHNALGALRNAAPDGPLTREQEKLLADQWNAGGSNERAALIRDLASQGRARGYAAVRQALPQNPAAALLVGLATMRDRKTGGERVTEAMAGFEQLRANPKLIDGPVAMDEFRRFAGAALNQMDGPTIEAAMTVAKGLYAQRAVRTGAERFDPEIWRQAVNDALGAAPGKTGGIADWRGEKVLLPTGVTASDLATLLGAVDQEQLSRHAAIDGRIGPKDYRGPVWNGKPMNADALTGLIPVAVGDGQYAFRNKAGQYAQGHGDNGLYVLDLRSLANAGRP